MAKKDNTNSSRNISGLAEVEEMIGRRGAPGFDPRLSMIDLYDTWELAVAAKMEAGQ